MAEASVEAPPGALAQAEGAPSACRDRIFSAVVFVLALLPRLYVAIAWAREPVWDGHYYDFGARRIAAGLGYSDDVMIDGRPVWHPWCHYPVGYSGFLGAIYRVFGHGHLVAPIANAVTGALLAVITHRLALRATSVTRARVAAVLVALSPGLVVYAALLMTEPLAALGVMTAAWLFARDAASKPMRGAALSGLVLGLTTLVRPPSLLCAPAIGVMALTLGRGSPLNWRAVARAGGILAVSLGCALAVVAPWSIRNCRVMDGCSLVSTNGGWNLAIGAFPRATGRFETLKASDGCPIVTGQVQQDRCWRDQGIAWIMADPARWLGLIPKKLGYTFDHESFPMGYLGEANPKDWPEARRAVGRGVLTAAHAALLFFAALGLLGRPDPRRDLRAALAQAGALVFVLYWGLRGALADERMFWPLAVFIPLLAALPLPGAPRRGGVVAYLAFAVASVIVTHIIFFGEDRYHMVVTPALCVLAACTLRRPDEGPALSS